MSFVVSEYKEKPDPIRLITYVSFVLDYDNRKWNVRGVWQEGNFELNERDKNWLNSHGISGADLEEYIAKNYLNIGRK